jgi:carboxyl-terminal processing protease
LRLKKIIAMSFALTAPLMLLGGSLIPVSKAGAIDGAVVAESLTEALAVVEANYAGNLDYERVTNASIEGMLRVLDPHSNYYNKEEFLELRSQQQSEYFGIGATIAQYQGKVYIHTPFDDTPAARAGLRYGDHIVNVNGQSTQGWNSSKVSSELKGPRGTSVTVSVARPGEAKPIEVKILRDAVALPTISSAYMIRPGVGYIALRRQFARTTGDEMRESVRKLKDQGMTTLLFDLRENPGGLVQAALEVCDLFLQRGQSILTIRGRKGTANVWMPAILVLKICQLSL